jgi:hypothetical protein
MLDSIPVFVQGEINSSMRLRIMSVVCVLFLFCSAPNLYSYSVLSHEAIVDSVWKDSIEPMLRQRFPRVTDRELKTAHAYAYGGSIIQDMGYYPFGSKFFTDLTHYVRSGDFVAMMLRDSVSLDEYAFALGALAHYASDTSGHPLGTNRAVPLLYPKLQRKYGQTVAYEDSPSAHLKTEFGFDVLEVSKGRFAPDAYRDFIGFEIAKPLLQLSFQHTYGLDLDEVFGTLDLAVGTYRRTVSNLIPKMTQVAWEMKQDEIQKSQPGVTRQKFLYNLSRADYEKDWGTQYEAPGLGTRTLAAFIGILPKVGPLRVLTFRTPTPEAEKLFMESFNATIDRYRSDLMAEQSHQTRPADMNLDVGAPSAAGMYKMSDDAYAKLVDKLAKDQFSSTPQELRDNILAFYKDGDAPISTKKNRRHWARLQTQLETLRKGPADSAR